MKYSNWKIERQLRKKLEATVIPDKRAVLPPEALLQSTKQPYRKPVFLRFATAAAVVLVVALGVVIGTNSVPNLGIGLSSSQQQETLLIAGDDPARSRYSSADTMFSEETMVVSETLQGVMTQYKNQNVLYHIVVGLPYGFEEERLQFAKEAGAMNVVRSTDSVLEKEFASAYVMDVPYETLEAMIAYKGYFILLATENDGK